MIIALKLWHCCDLCSFIYDLLHLSESFCDFLFYPGVLISHNPVTWGGCFYFIHSVRHVNRIFCLHGKTWKTFLQSLHSLEFFSGCWISGSRMEKGTKNLNLRSGFFPKLSSMLWLQSFLLSLPSVLSVGPLRFPFRIQQTCLILLEKYSYLMKGIIKELWLGELPLSAYVSLYPFWN